ncbi:hypothetical protein ACFL6I_15105 [candidate division KSB1 bacterium]
MKLLKNKKAQSLPEEPNYAIYFMIAAAIIAMFAIFLVIATSTYQVETTSILGGLESSVLEFKLLNSPECFVYQDKITKRVYSHVIDLEKFTDETVSKCINPWSKVCFSAELNIDDKTIRTVKNSRYIAPKEVKVSIWPVKIRSKDDEKSGFMHIKTSKQCS